MILAISTMDPTLLAVLLGAAFVLALVVLIQTKATSILAWACALGFGALAWNAVAAA